MTGKTTAAPIRIGVLGAARIADLAIAAGLPPRPAGQPLINEAAH